MTRMQQVPRRGVILAGLATALPALAQDFPARPVRIVVIAPPGTSPDIALRLLAEPLARRWGQPVVVDNRAGANGNLGAQAILRGAPDGHLLLFTSASPMVMNEHLTRNMPFNPARDFTPISLALTTPFMISASPTLGVSTMDELVTLARGRPAPLTFASPGATTVARFTGERMGRAAGIPLVNIPYNSSAQGVTDLLAGRVDLMVDGTPVLAPLAGVKHLAVTSAERIPGFETVPTLAEAFPRRRLHRLARPGGAGGDGGRVGGAHRRRFRRGADPAGNAHPLP